MTIRELIAILEEFQSDTQIIVDWDGDTSNLELSMVRAWDPNDPNSPLAIFV